MEMMGEFPFEADLWRDSEGTVGAVSADGPRGTTWLFVSLTEGGTVYTQTAARDGDVTFDGERLVTTASGDRDGVLAAHIAAAGDLRTDADALDKLLEGAPQAAVRLAEETMKQFAAGLS
jgi:hypothetical protein